MYRYRNHANWDGCCFIASRVIWKSFHRRMNLKWCAVRECLVFDIRLIHQCVDNNKVVGRSKTDKYFRSTLMLSNVKNRQSETEEDVD